MLFTNVVMLVLSIVFLAYSSDFATRFSSRLARMIHMSEFMLSFFIVALISAMPETAVSIVSVFQGIPEFGFATLIGSNIADLTLVFGIVILFSKAGVSVRSQILRKDFLYLFLLLFPMLLGSDGFFSASDGILLMLSGVFFFFSLSLEVHAFRKEALLQNHKHIMLNLFFLLVSLAILIASANFTVRYGVAVADNLGIPEVLIGLIIVSIGTCLPELIFSLRAVKNNHDSLALGDILGTVIIDGTFILGLIAFMSPFTIHPNLVYVTGGGMFIAGLLTVILIRHGKVISKKEALLLILLYIIHFVVQLFLTR